MNLTPKQEKFAQKYIELGNAAEAYRQSYDAKKMTDKTTWEAASRLLADSKVAARVNELKELHLKAHVVTVNRVLEEYARLAFADVRKAFDPKGNLKPIHEIPDDIAAAIAGIDIVENQCGASISAEGIRAVESYTKKLKFADKKGTLDSLAKHLGMFTDTIKVTHDYEEMTDDELIALARSKGIVTGENSPL
ncbi:terminase small subunit [Limnoglobus roseus]|uniref:Terminase small subunit n=1 Tax=Limnoglobus roseus TaxID=2598579 RepID=A0A5C1AKB1_9BACT|nr:terminase small subunit [Limnoglobus roseus]QEL19330.1 terminase small subunit [Limnoglobus roseus]